MNDSTLKSAITQSWNTSCEKYDQNYTHGILSEAENREWLKLFSRIFGNKKANILDVGTGTGFIALYAARLGHTCKGIDLSEGMLSVARKKAAQLKLEDKLTLETGDAEKLCEADSCYDFVTNRHLLWTLPHPEQAIREWIRVLKPGGTLVIIDGTWFYSSTVDSVKIFLGKLLALFTERKNLFKKASGGGYTKEVYSNLPMTDKSNAKKAVELVKSFGLDVRVEHADDVERAERSAASLSQRLRYPYRRYIIIATKK